MILLANTLLTIFTCRTREAERPKKPTLLPHFATTRKFRSTRPTMFEANQRASQQERKQPQVRRGPSMRKPVQYDDALMTLPPNRHAGKERVDSSLRCVILASLLCVCCLFLCLRTTRWLKMAIPIYVLRLETEVRTVI